MRNVKRSTFAVVAAAAVACLGVQAHAVIFPEFEPNDTKFTPNVVGPMMAGDVITGTSTGTSTTVPGVASSDNFLVRVAPLPLGIYEHRLVITTQGAAGHTGTLRGSTVTAAPADTLAGIPWNGVIGTPNVGTDSALQTSSTLTVPQRYNQ